MGWGLASLGLGIATGGLEAYGQKRGQDQAARLSEARLQEALAALGIGRHDINRGFGQAVDEQRSSIGTLQQGVLNALASLDDGFASEVRRVMDERAQASAGLEQDLVGRGLYGSTAAVNFQRALSGDAQRAMGDIQARFSGARADTFLQGAGAVAGGQSGLANLFAQRGSALAGNQAQKASILTQHPVPVQNQFANFGQLGATGMQGIGMIQQGQQNAALIDAIRGLGGSGGQITGF
jgi:hypothetical protein